MFAIKAIKAEARKSEAESRKSDGLPVISFFSAERIEVREGDGPTTLEVWLSDKQGITKEVLIVGQRPDQFKSVLVLNEQGKVVEMVRPSTLQQYQQRVGQEQQISQQEEQQYHSGNNFTSRYPQPEPLAR